MKAFYELIILGILLYQISSADAQAMSTDTWWICLFIWFLIVLTPSNRGA
jgi:hypothetical protein